MNLLLNMANIHRITVGESASKTFHPGLNVFAFRLDPQQLCLAGFAQFAIFVS